MPRFSVIALFLLLRYQTSTAQTGYKETDTLKYTISEIITNVNGFKTTVFYKGNDIRKITREFTGSSFSSTTIYYITNDQLIHNVFVSKRGANDYFEEHMYFANGKMTKWYNTKNKDVKWDQEAFDVKEKLALHYFEVDLKEAKTKKAMK